MSDDSRIEWTDATWNPVRGCTKISPGCKHCYAETFAERFRGVPGHPYEQGFDLRLVPENLDQPLRWWRSRRIFVNSMSDLFHDEIPIDFIGAVFGVMAVARRHTFQVLTKRPEKMEAFLRWLVHQETSNARKTELNTFFGDPVPAIAAMSYALDHGVPLTLLYTRNRGSFVWPLPNIWLGVSVEDRKHGVPRIDILRDVPAAVRFLSIEPLLEDLGELDLEGIHWVIVGGESGAGAREMRPEWVRSIRDQCAAADVPFFFKQWGGVRKKLAGRELDGRTHDAFPVAR